MNYVVFGANWTAAEEKQRWLWQMQVGREPAASLNLYLYLKELLQLATFYPENVCTPEVYCEWTWMQSMSLFYTIQKDDGEDDLNLAL